MSKKKVYIVAIVTIVLATIVEALFAHPHHHNLWDVVPGFDILFGLVGCGVLIIVAKKIVGPILERKEDYYESDDEGGEGND